MKKRARQQKKLTVRMLSLIMASLLLLLVIPFAAIASGQESPEPGKKGDFRLFKDFYATTKVTLTEDQESSVTVSAELSENEIYVKSYQWQAYSLGARRYVNMGQYGKSVSINENLVSAYDYGNGNSYLRCQALVSDSDMQQTLTSDVLTVVLPRKQAEPSQNEESSETVETGENTDPTQPEATDPTGEPTSENTQPAEEPEDTGTTAGLSDETTGNVTSPTCAEKTGEEDKKDEPAEDEGEPVKGQLLEPLVPDGEDGEKEGEEGDLPQIRGMLLEPLMRGTADISITFDLDGGIGVDNMTGLTSGDSQVIGTPTKSGYVFKGWTLTSPEGLADDVVTELQDSADNGNITVPEYSVAFKATWEAVQYVEPTFTTTKYTIEYWLDDPETGEYPDEPYHVTIVNNIEPNTTVSLSTDQKTFPDSTLKDYSHTYSIDAGPKQINANGTTVFKLKFKRNTYSFKFDMYSYFNSASFSTVPTLFVNSAYYTNNKNNMYTVTARYGQVISDQWPNSGDYNNPVRLGTTYYYQYVKIDNLSRFYSGNPRRVTSTLIPNTKSADGSEITCYVQYSNSSSTPHQVYYYKQKLNGTYEEAAHYYGSTTQSVNVGISFEGFNYNNVKSHNTGNSSAKTYYKYYDRKSYNFYVVYPDGYTTSTSYVFEQSIGQPTPDYGSDQYSFIGWYSDPEFQNKIEDTEWANMTMPAHDLSVYAKWSQSTEIKTVNVYTYKDDNNALQGALTPITTTTGTPAKPSSEVQNRSREGYRFVRWVNNATSETFVFNQTVVNSDITVYGEWENAIVNYTVSFYLDKGNMTGTPHHSETVEKDGTVGSFAAPGRTGYDFAGWYYGEGAGKMPFRFTGDSNPTVITSDMNVYAEWTIHSHKFIVKFKDDQGNERENSRDDKDYGASISQPTGLSWEGRTFTNEWYNDSGLTDRLTSWPITMPDSDKTVYAKWTVNSYSVRFYGDENDTNPRLTTSVLYNGTVDGNLTTDWGPLNAQSDQPSRNRAFDGWYYYDGAEKKTFVLGADGTKITGNTKVYINWAPMYTVKFYSDSTLSGDPLASETVKSGDRIAQAPADPTSVDGSQTFNGWYYNAGTVETPDIQPFTFGATGVAVDKNIDVYAAWLDNEITLIIHNNASRVNIFYITKSDESGFRLRVAVAGNSGSTTVVHLPFTQSASGTSMYTVTPEGWDYRNNYSPVSSLVNEENGGILAANQTYHVTFGGTSKGLNWLGGYSPFPPASN